MFRFLFLLLLSFALTAAEKPQKGPPPPRIPPEQIEAELADAQAQFDHALKLFNPWYTGPLITPSATMVPPGSAMIQPYIYFTDNYGTFDANRHRVSAPNQFTIKTQPVLIEIGVTPSVDTTVIMGTLAQWKEGKFGGGFQDIVWQIGFKVTEQTLYVPKSKFSISQSFPTGKYQNLDPTKLGLDATGAGAWGTTFTFTVSKLFFWNTLHPFNTRLSLGYQLNSNIQVQGFNAYGGGYGTNGVVRPGNDFTADLGLELSINQPWVIALDLVYNYTNQTTFVGNLGTTTKTGTTPATVGSGFSDQLSLAPAVEYNFNANMGVLAGLWFTVYGRNASNFVSGVFSWYWEFP